MATRKAFILASLALAVAVLGPASALATASGQQTNRAARGAAPASAVKDRFVGTWRLHAEFVQDENGNIVGQLFGKDGVGKLTYTERGDVWAFVGRADRTFSLWYTGTFDVRPNAHNVVHHLQYSSSVGLEGTDLIRRYRFHGDDRLALSFLLGGGQTDVLKWKKV